MNIAIHLYTCVGVWFWALLGVIALYSVPQQNWIDIVIVAIMGVVSFAVVLVATWIMCMIADMGSWIKASLGDKLYNITDYASVL